MLVAQSRQRQLWALNPRGAHEKIVFYLCSYYKEQMTQKYYQDQILLETSESVMVISDDGELKIYNKKWVRNGEKYEPLDNTLDESTINYLQVAKTWRLRSRIG